MMASIIVVFGLPITVGDILPSRAYTMGYDIDPEPALYLSLTPHTSLMVMEVDRPGHVVPPVGKTLSWLVKRK